LAEYQKVTTILEVLQTLTEEDWQHWARWQVQQHYIMLPLMGWQAELQLKLRAWGVDPFRLRVSWSSRADN